MKPVTHIALSFAAFALAAALARPAVAAVPSGARISQTTASVSGTMTILPDVDLSTFSASDFLLPRSYYKKRMEKIIDQWQGVPYVWGGCTKSGTDCSGFVMGVFRELGVRLPHGSRYLKTCEVGSVVTGKWMYGDVLIWDPPGRGRPGHAAIYTGNGTTAETVSGRVWRSLVSKHRPPTVVRRFLDAVCTLGDVVPQDESEDVPSARPMREMIELITQGKATELRERLETDPTLINLVDCTGATLLHWAADRGSADCANALIDCGANVSRRKNNGVTPLHVAAALGREEVARLLLDRGADPNASDFRDRTPISLARVNDQQNMVVILLRDSRTDDRDPAIPADFDPAPTVELDPAVPAALDAPLPLPDTNTLRPMRADAPATPAAQTAVAPVEYVEPDDPECREMLDLINGERYCKGLAPLRYDPVAQKIAQAKAEDMVERDYFSHSSPTYGTPSDMLKREGLTVRTWAENIAACNSVQTAHSSLMASKEHKAALLSRGYGRIGIGVVQGGRWGRVFVQLLLGE